MISGSMLQTHACHFGNVLVFPGDGSWQGVEMLGGLLSNV